MKYNFIDNTLLSRLGSLPIESRVPMMGNVAGKHRSPHRGSSVEFAEYRKYVPGDDTRRLDWKAFARSDRFYIKEFEADTNLRAYFVVDASGRFMVTTATPSSTATSTATCHSLHEDPPVFPGIAYIAERVFARCGPFRGGQLAFLSRRNAHDQRAGIDHGILRHERRGGDDRLVADA